MFKQKDSLENTENDDEFRKLINDYYERFQESVPVYQIPYNEIESRIKIALMTGRPIEVGPDDGKDF
jgi:hypothetical protein